MRAPRRDDEVELASAEVNLGIALARERKTGDAGPNAAPKAKQRWSTPQKKAAKAAAKAGRTKS